MSMLDYLLLLHLIRHVTTLIVTVLDSKRTTNAKWWLHFSLDNDVEIQLRAQLTKYNF